MQKIIGNEKIAGDDFYTMERFMEIEKFHDVDILIVGSSRAFIDYDPRIFAERGLKIFILGCCNQTPLNSYYLLKRYYRQLNPKLVVMDIYPLMFEEDGLESFDFLVLNVPLSKEMIEMAIACKSPSAISSLIATWFGQLSRPLGKYATKKHCGIYISGGYTPRSDTKEENKLSEYFKKEFKINMLDMQLNYLKKNIEFVKKMGGKFVMAVGPLPAGFLKKNINYTDNMRRFKSIAEQYQVDCIDFNIPEKPYSNRCFADIYHLGTSGVKIYNETLLETLFRKNVLNKK